MKKLLSLLIVTLSVINSFAQKPDYIRTANGPNTIVDWNLKAKTFVLPHGATVGLYGSQDTTGNVYFHVGGGDTSLNIRVAGLKWWNPVANFFTKAQSDARYAPIAAGAGYVPYLGANTNVNLNPYNITAVGHFIPAGHATYGALELMPKQRIDSLLAAKQNLLGYTPEDIANKATSFGTISNTLYPSTQAVYNYSVALGGSYSNPSWISSLAWSKITGAPTSFPTPNALTFGYGFTGQPFTFDGSGAVTSKIDSAAIQTVGNFFTLGNTKYYTKTQSDARFAPIAINGTVTSITPGYGFTSSTPITTSGTMTIDTTKLLTVTGARDNVASLYNKSLFSPQTDYMLFTSGNILTAPTPSGSNVTFGKFASANFWGFKGSSGNIVTFSWGGLSANRTFTFPNSAGTFALTTIDNAFSQPQSMTGLNIYGAAGQRNINLSNETVASVNTPVSAVNFYGTGGNSIGWKNTSGFNALISSSGISADRTYTLPDASGTLAIASPSGSYVDKADSGNVANNYVTYGKFISGVHSLYNKTLVNSIFTSSSTSLPVATFRADANAGSTGPNLLLETATTNTNYGGIIVMRASKGTLASPTQFTTGGLGGIFSQGYNDVGGWNPIGGAVRFTTAGAQTSTNAGTNIVFQTTQQGSLVRNDIFIIQADQQLRIVPTLNTATTGAFTPMSISSGGIIEKLTPALLKTYTGYYTSGDNMVLGSGTTASTQSPGTNNTTLATTAYTDAAVAAGSGFTFRGSGQTTLVLGTKAISVTGVTTSSQVFVNAISQGGTVSTTFEYAAVPTSGTITITALTTGNVTNTLDTSTLSYFVIN